MELMTRGVRQSGMMPVRRVRGSVAVLLGAVLLGAVLLGAGVAGCGSATASAPAGAASSSSATSSATASSGGSSASSSASAAASAPAAATGCASVNQATSVTVIRSMHLVEPTRAGALSKTQHNAALVRALFGQFCAAVSQAGARPGTVHCPADFGVSYSGTFYAGSRPLATFVYGASGCQTVSITADGKTRSAMVLGAASAAAPRLRADMAAVLGEPASMLVQPGSQSGQSQSGQSQSGQSQSGQGGGPRQLR